MGKTKRFFAAVAALLVAALAAASVSAATSPLKSATKSSAAGQGWELTAGHVNDKGQNIPLQPAGTTQLAPGQSSQVNFINSPTPSNANSILAHDRSIPGKLGSSGGTVPNAAAAPNATLIPSAPSLPIVSAPPGTVRARGLNAYDQASIGGYTDTPPDQALAEGPGYVLEAVNNVLEIAKNVPLAPPLLKESMETFWAPAFNGNYCSISDPKAHYDNVTLRWYVTEVAYGPPGCVPGSAIFLAVSQTSSPFGPYKIYVINTSFDGTTCTGTDGCLADQPLLGMDRNALFISTNSYNWDTPAFNGTQLYIIDSQQLAAWSNSPTVVYFDLGGNVPTPEGANGCGQANNYPADAYCWYSIQPATTPDNAFTTDRGGTEFFTSALDWLGSVDNRVAVWAITNTSSMNSTPHLYLNYAIANTESYGFPFTSTPFFSPYAEQPSSGNTPLCDVFAGPYCEPGPIANNDDRMNELESYKPTVGATHLWSGLNTDALVADPIGGLHRRSAIAYFDTKPTAWFGPYIIGAGVYGQGYVANWNNDVIFPAIGIVNSGFSNGAKGAMVFTLTGNTNFSSVAYTRVTDSPPPTSISVALAGQDVLDDFAWYFFGSPRWGDYSAAVGDGNYAFLATEYIQYQSCSDSTYHFIDPTCGGTRSEFSNWGTGLTKVNV